CLRRTPPGCGSRAGGSGCSRPPPRPAAAARRPSAVAAGAAAATAGGGPVPAADRARPHRRDHAEQPPGRPLTTGRAALPVGFADPDQRLELVPAAGAAVLVERHASSLLSAGDSGPRRAGRHLREGYQVGTSLPRGRGGARPGAQSGGVAGCWVATRPASPACPVGAGALSHAPSCSAVTG